MVVIINDIVMGRGLRNNNPGNIRHDGVKWKGEVVPSQDRSFKQFESRAWGYRAMFHLINNYQRLHGCTTLRKIIARWAPPSENKTDCYIEFVAKKSGVSPDGRITTTYRDVMIPIVSAMSQMENGVPAIVSEVNEGWNLFMQHKQ